MMISLDDASSCPTGTIRPTKPLSLGDHLPASRHTWESRHGTSPVVPLSVRHSVPVPRPLSPASLCCFHFDNVPSSQADATLINCVAHDLHRQAHDLCLPVPPLGTQRRGTVAPWACLFVVVFLLLCLCFG